MPDASSREVSPPGPVVLPTPALVIFDCDGVLVDTEPVTLRTWHAFLLSLGLELDDTELRTRCKGIHITRIKAWAEGRLGRAVPGFIDGFRERMFAEFARGIEPIAGAIECLDALDRAGIAYAVGSNGPHIKMDASLASSGLFDRLRGRVYSADDVDRPKPAPDLFLHAAERMAADPARCVVVEDSPSGITAALDAGMGAVGYVDVTPGEELAAAGAHAVLESMADFPATIGIAPLG